MLVSVDAVVSAPRKSSMEARMDTFGEKAKRDFQREIDAAAGYWSF